MTFHKFLLLVIKKIKDYLSYVIKGYTLVSQNNIMLSCQLLKHSGDME